MFYTYKYDSPLGAITLASNGKALTGVWFDGQKNFGSTLPYEYQEKYLPVFGETTDWLNIYFSGKEPDFVPHLCLYVTPFQKAVSEIMISIPYGKTITYGEIANEIVTQTGAERMSARAVGSVVAHNAISIIVPCHRVVGAGGNLAGYAGGLERKIKLLELEKADMSVLHMPQKYAGQ